MATKESTDVLCSFQCIPTQQHECDRAFQHSIMALKNLARFPREYFPTRKKYVWFTRLTFVLALTLTLAEGQIES